MSKRKYLSVGVILWVFATIFTVAPIWPNFYYRLFPKTSEDLASTLSQPVLASSQPLPEPTTAPTKPQIQPALPDFDPTLPEANGLIISKIGVRGEIHEGDNWQEILKLGIWLVPDFGTPENNQLPIILAAHRWGYLSWTNSFRTLNSFYNLPKLDVGDQIQIVWNQRQYTYEIYKSESGTQISDYNANLILYTCQLWNSPLRIFKYAKRIL